MILKYMTIYSTHIPYRWYGISAASMCGVNNNVDDDEHNNNYVDNNY